MGVVGGRGELCLDSHEIARNAGQILIDPPYPEDAMLILTFIMLMLVPDFARAELPDYFQQEEKELANEFIDGIMYVNGREFLMGDLHEWPKGTHDYGVHFMIRSSIWLREFLDRDPILMYQDFDIRRTQDSSFIGTRYLEHQMAVAPDPSMGCLGCPYYPALDAVLQVDGYETYSNERGYLIFLPRSSDIAHGFRCRLARGGTQSGELDSCSVTVVYPYATNIVLNGRRQRPGTVAEYGPSFAAIAKRMLEVVTCIDVTEKEMNDYSTGLSELLESHPNLIGCRIDLTG